MHLNGTIPKVEQVLTLWRRAIASAWQITWRPPLAASTWRAGQFSSTFAWSIWDRILLVAWCTSCWKWPLCSSSGGTANNEYVINAITAVRTMTITFWLNTTSQAPQTATTVMPCSLLSVARHAPSMDNAKSVQSVVWQCQSEQSTAQAYLWSTDVWSPCNRTTRMPERIARTMFQLDPQCWRWPPCGLDGHCVWLDQPESTLLPDLPEQEACSESHRDGCELLTKPWGKYKLD